MPVNWLSEAERERFNNFPQQISEADIIAFFTLTTDDQELINQHHAGSNKLGVAIQLCTLRYLGFIPDELTLIPSSAISFLAQQLGVSIELINVYGQRDRTRTDHIQEIQQYLGFYKANPTQWMTIEQWLVERALEHDRPLLLLSLLCERLYTAKITRPGITTLERTISTARQRAQEQTWQLISPLLKEQDKAKLDKLLMVDEKYKLTPLTWFRTPATSHSPAAIVRVLEKIADLRELGIEQWNLSLINPNRLKLLAQVGRKATNVGKNGE